MRIHPLILCIFSLPAIAEVVLGGTTINTSNKYAYGANVGWMDWRGDTNSGAVVGQYVCSGYVYAANVGWISLGSGSPTNGIQYQNNSSSDFGVNHDGVGNLRGIGYGANIGWINFETNGAPKVNLLTGTLSGYVYSANCGWISLSNIYARVQTDTLSPGQLGTNGLPVAWMLTYFGTTNVPPNADPDGDGMSNRQEYIAGTNPTLANSKLNIVAFSPLPVVSNSQSANLTWTSQSSRLYYVEKSSNLNSNVWSDSGFGIITPDGTNTTRNLLLNGSMQFFRVRAVLPLTP